MTEQQLDESSAEPLHAQLRKIFIEKIRTGSWEPGERISAELELSEEYTVSRSTIRQAVLALVNDGYLSRKRGKGTFVNPEKRDLSVLDLKFSIPSDSDHQLLKVATDYEDPSVAGYLSVAVNEPLTLLQRIRYINSEPVALESSWLVTRHFPDLTNSNMSLPLWDILQNDFDTQINYDSTAIEPVILSEDEERLLSCPTSPTAALLITRLGSTSDRQPVVYSQSLFRGDTSRAIFRSDADSC